MKKSLFCLFILTLSSCCTLTSRRSTSLIRGTPSTIIRDVTKDKYLATIERNGYASINLENSSENKSLLFIRMEKKKL